MSLFQKSILNKYLTGIDNENIYTYYDTYKSYFHDPAIQNNLRGMKEEQFQEGFLRELFVKVMGYTIAPDANYNLITEQKNEADSKKADGAILINDKVIAVIELKGMNTIDLNKIQQQAFYYLSAHPDAVYVITSNYEKLRFYIHKSNEYEEFNLFNLTLEQFKLLWVCLSYESISNGLPERIKTESVVEEENITKKLYKDYSNFKIELFNSLVKLNPQYDKIQLFKASQKLIDRFLFIFFCEDNNSLLPANSISEIITHWNRLREMDEYRPLYDIFKKYFEYINTGRPEANGKQEIFAYNGGLFALDPLLDQLHIDDTVLYTHTQKLTKYDFVSEVDVNILGHIFENSLNDIEEIQSEIEGKELDKSKTKRKKDGVFYTPKYITEYIVENTIGKLCEQKRMELNISEDEYVAAATKSKRKPLLDKLNEYKSYLLSLTICDPACGSGAFLNQAFIFLQKEHNYISELESKLFNAPIQITDVTADILERNLYGVDINEESVEIAKLSLWLRTAKKGRKLNSLSNNIKCGNSLINDPSVAGDKAFNWEKEFPNVFKQKELQGYHVVLTTHNSRISQRMVDYNVHKGPPIHLSLLEEIELTKIIGKIIIDDGINCLAYNICKDHVHMLLVCDPDELTNHIQKIKSVSSKLYHRLDIPRGHDPLEHKNHLWSQKFYRVQTDEWTLASLSNEPGILYHDSHLTNSISYINRNRDKHNLPPSDELQKIISGFIVDKDRAYATQYKGGFDVIIGNPPYLRMQGLIDAYPEMVEYYNGNFHAATANYDIYTLFMERSYSLINHNGVISFILPHKFLISDFGQGIRRFLSDRQAVQSILHFEEHLVFEVTTYTCIINITRNKNQNLLFKYINPQEISNPFDWSSMNYEGLDESNWNLMDQRKQNLFQKLHENPYTLKDVFSKIFQGIATSADKIYLIDGVDEGANIRGYSASLDKEVIIERAFVKPLLKGQDVNRYTPLVNNYFVIFPYIIANGKASNMEESYIAKHFPLGYQYLKDNESELRAREKGRMDKEGWFLYIYPKSLSEFDQTKLITPEIANRGSISIDTNSLYHTTTVYSFLLDSPSIERYKYYLSILNSKLFWFFLSSTGTVLRGGYFRFKTNYLFPFPVPNEPQDLTPYVDLVDKALEFKKSQINRINKFISRIQSNFSLSKISGNLSKFYEGDFSSFVSELRKQKVKLSLVQQDEWEDYFNTYKAEITSLQSQIDATDKAIDRMVYELYGLTAEEIKIVEENG